MTTQNHLYLTLLSMINLGQWKDVRHARCFCDMLCGLLQSGKISLTHWRAYSQSEASQAQSFQRRYHRWFHNPAIVVERISRRLLLEVVTPLLGDVVYLGLDTTVIWNKYCQARLVLIYRGRAIPLAWKTVEHSSSSLADDVYAPLLDQVDSLFPKSQKRVLLADRGFGVIEWMQHCQRLGWEFHIRIKGKIYFYLQEFGCPIAHMIPQKRGEGRFLHFVKIGHKQVGYFHLALAKPRGTQETWMIVSSLKTGIHTFEEYGRRFDMEENFLDDKSNGFGGESTRMDSAQTHQKLTLLRAVATLYFVTQGTHVVEQKKRRWVDPHWDRGASYFKIGWQWGLTAIQKQWDLIQEWNPLKNDWDDKVYSSRKNKKLKQKKLEKRITDYWTEDFVNLVSTS